MMGQFDTLANKVAIVTGASRGIGAGIAYELARRGAKVAITYTSSSSEPQVNELLIRIAALNKSPAISIKADLRSPSSPPQIVQQTTSTFGPNIDILVNNAGVELWKAIPDITLSEFASVYDLNVRATLLMLQSILPHLRAPGRIVNIGSVGARAGFAQFSVYCSSKSALEGMTRCWAAELGKEGHTVNTVNPGPVQTDMLGKIPGEMIEMQKSQTPLQNRIASTNDVAQVVAWLASEESRWVTGQAISASGGWQLY